MLLATFVAFLVGIVSSTDLYGLILTASSYLVAGLTPLDLYQLAQTTTGLSSALCWFMIGSLPAAPIALILRGLSSRAVRRSMHMTPAPQKDDDDYMPPFYSFCERLGADFSNLLRGLHSIKHIFSKSEERGLGVVLAKVESMLHFIWAVVFIAFVILSFSALRMVVIP